MVIYFSPTTTPYRSSKLSNSSYQHPPVPEAMWVPTVSPPSPLTNRTQFEPTLRTRTVDTCKPPTQTSHPIKLLTNQNQKVIQNYQLYEAGGLPQGARVFPIFETMKTGSFSANALSRFASVVLDSVLGPLLLSTSQPISKSLEGRLVSSKYPSRG